MSAAVAMDLADEVEGEGSSAGLGGQTFIPCSDYNNTVNYFTRTDVLAVGLAEERRARADPVDVSQALHVSPKAFAWQPCSTHLQYTQFRCDPVCSHSVRRGGSGFVRRRDTPTLYQKMITGKLRVMVYSGDLDRSVAGAPALANAHRARTRAQLRSVPGHAARRARSGLCARRRVPPVDGCR